MVYNKAIADIAAYTGRDDLEFGVNVGEDGIVSFVDENDAVITDPNLIALLKKHPSYISQKDAIQAKSFANAEEHARLLQEQTDAFLTIHKLAPQIMSTEDVEKLMRALNPKTYGCEPFPIAPPDIRSIESELEQEASATIKALLPGKKKKLIAEYVASNVGKVYDERLRSWTADKQAHEAREAQKKQEADARGAAEYEEARTSLQAGWKEAQASLSPKSSLGSLRSSFP